MSKENVALADVTLRTAKVNQGNSYRQPLLPMMLQQAPRTSGRHHV